VAPERDSSAYKAELRMANPDALIRPGMVARVFLASSTMKDVLIIPLACVIPDKGDHVVYVVENGRVARRVVQLDAFQGYEAVIRSGLKSGDIVVVDGARGLTDGAMVIESR
jgi:multidrug efflux pump subunit AcrA (membrane-fusion protein)